MDRRLREEQDAAFQQSLLEDQQREREREEQAARARMQAEEEDKQRLEKEDKVRDGRGTLKDR